MIVYRKKKKVKNRVLGYDIIKRLSKKGEFCKSDKERIFGELEGKKKGIVIEDSYRKYFILEGRSG